MTFSHRTKIEQLYRNVKYPDAIDLWSAIYAKDELDIAISNARHLDPVRQKIENEVWRKIIPSNGCVLDLGCGRGFFSERLHHLMCGEVNVTGIDLSVAILSLAQSEHQKIDFVQGLAEKVPFKEDAFDAVLVIATFEHIENPKPVIGEIKRILKPQGYLYLCLHKPFIDPFVLPEVAKVLFQTIKRLASGLGPRNRREESLDYNTIGYKGTLRELRRNLRSWFSEASFQWIESREILHQLEWKVYKILIPWAIPYLIRMGSWLNRLPISYYKNLEYWLLRKP